MRIGYNLLEPVDPILEETIKYHCGTDSGNANLIFSFNKKRRQGIETLPCSPMFLPQKPEGQMSWIRQQISLPFAIVRNNIDILFCPAMNLPLRQPCKTAVLIEDPGPIIFRDEKFCGLDDKIKYFFRVSAAKKANRIFVFSSFNKKVIAKALKIDPARIDILPRPVLDIFRPVFDTERIQKILNKHNIGSPYYFYCGDFFNKNNIKELIEIFIGLLMHKSNATLVLAGRGVGSLEQMKENNVLRNRIVFIEGTDDEELTLLFNGAAAFISASLFEPFPVRAQQAAACGVPVICYDNSSFSEILGDACILIKNGDKQSFVKAMCDAKDNQNLRLKLRALGIQRARSFTLDKTSEALLKSFKDIDREKYYPDAK
ncbi:MAG: glycosyltransferase [Candidatus Saganbacteria bacterium]|nr:glycosyltransferase [Candidatus Saganbacteria bacterium]